MPRTPCNAIAATHCRIEASLDWLLTTSYGFDTASTGIQETESLRTKAADRRKGGLCERLDQRRLRPLQAVGGENAYAQSTSLIQRISGWQVSSASVDKSASPHGVE
jgi:hypothetical protein